MASKKEISYTPEEFEKDIAAGAKVTKKRNESGELLSILQDKYFFENILRELDKTIVGEEDTKRTMILVALGGKLTENAEPTSTNLMINDESGAGKDYITKAIVKILPNDKEQVIIRKRISEKVFCYWHNAKFEPDWTWDGKVFYNEDISNSILNSDVFKVMSSSDGENKSTILINQTPFEIVTKGKPVMLITIAVANPKIELLRRFPMINIDTTEDQTKEILKRKALLHERGIKPSYDEIIKRAIASLHRCKVKVPFASKLTTVLSTRNIIIRTHFDRLIDYIKFSAAIYQYQRVKDDECYLLATEDDYNNARIALIKTTSNIFSVPLTKHQKKILDILKDLQTKEPEATFSINELEPHITFVSDRQLRRDLDKLANFGFLEKGREERANIKQAVMTYKYLELHKIKIPKWDEIQNMSKVSKLTKVSNVSKVSKDKKDDNDLSKVNQDLEIPIGIDTFDTFDNKTRDTELTKFTELESDYLGKCSYCGRQKEWIKFKDSNGNHVCANCREDEKK